MWTEVNGVITSQEVFYLHDDLLGSSDTVTNGSGAVVERIKYEPFGARRDPASLASPASVPHAVIRKGFTGHEPDDEFSLINMKGRMYDSTTGRFLSADPFVAAPAFGQSLNRYSYVLNSPLTYVDPSGFEDAGVQKTYGEPAIPSDQTSMLDDLKSVLERIASWFSSLPWAPQPQPGTIAEQSDSPSAAVTGHADKQGSQSGGLGGSAPSYSNNGSFAPTARPGGIELMNDPGSPNGIRDATESNGKEPVRLARRIAT